MQQFENEQEVNDFFNKRIVEYNEQLDRLRQIEKDLVMIRNKAEEKYQTYTLRKSQVEKEMNDLRIYRESMELLDRQSQQMFDRYTSNEQDQKNREAELNKKGEDLLKEGRLLESQKTLIEEDNFRLNQKKRILQMEENRIRDMRLTIDALIADQKLEEELKKIGKWVENETRHDTAVK